jgi:hypothetical protein
MIDHNDITIEQSAALVRVFTRHVRDTDHLDFRNMGFIDWIQRDVAKTYFDDSIMACVPTMWIGIEPDGYTHT